MRGADLADLYQEVILDHGRRPRNFGPLEEATHSAEGLNPLCGDHFTIFAKLEDGKVGDARFVGSGCAISKASASVMTGVVKGKTPAEIDALFERFRRLVTEGANGEDAEGLGKLAVFAGVHGFPSRVKCASLAWHALRAALSGEREAVTTE